LVLPQAHPERRGCATLLLENLAGLQKGVNSTMLVLCPRGVGLVGLLLLPRQVVVELLELGDQVGQALLEVLFELVVDVLDNFLAD
jgi:hypothetical protein